jgi:serine/threonine protein kinase
MKCIQVLDDESSEDIAKEINLLKKCRNNHIVNYYGSYFKDGKVWVRNRILYAPAYRILMVY